MSVPDKAFAPDLAGVHWHTATYGEVVVVATASQPVITSPLAINLTFPGAPAVALTATEPKPNTALPPDITNVGVVAANAGTPIPAATANASAPTKAPRVLLFIVVLPLS